MSTMRYRIACWMIDHADWIALVVLIIVILLLALTGRNGPGEAWHSSTDN